MRKIPRQHIYFWLLYFLFTTLIEYLWDKATLPALSQPELVIDSVLSNVFSMVAKLLFAYYLLFFAERRVAKDKGTAALPVMNLILVLCACILLDRVINNLLVLPYVYHGVIETASLFEPRRLIIVILYMGFSAGLLLAIESVTRQVGAVQREKELLKQQLETELQFLRNQMNPHFLMNTLNNIYALATKKSDETAEVVMRLSELLRFMLYESNDKLIGLAGEIRVLEDYVELEQIRYGNRLMVHFNRQTDRTDYMLPPLLLLPFVENAFKYGVSETRFESFITIDISVTNGILEFIVRNSTDNTDMGQTASSIGLRNVSRRLELIYKDYQLDVQNNKNVFEVLLTVKLDSYAEI